MVRRSRGLALVAKSAGRAGRAGEWPLPALRRLRLAAERLVLAIGERVLGLDDRVELARALVDHRGLGVPEIALHRELVRIAVRAVDLDRVEGALDRVLGRVPLC